MARRRSGFGAGMLRALKHFQWRFAAPAAHSALNWSILPRTNFDYQREVGDGSLSSVVMACVNVKVTAWHEATIRMETQRPQEGEMVWSNVSDHPALRRLAFPNSAYSAALLWWATVLDWNLSGNAYWLMVRSKAGVPAELWYTPSDTMKPCWPKDGSRFLSHYEFKPDPGMSKPFEIEPEQVVHFRRGLDATTRKGIAPLASVYREIFTDDEASNFTASLLRNMGVPGVVIAPSKDAGDDYIREFDDDDAAATKAMFREAVTGDYRGDPLVFGEPVSIQQLSFSPDQMNLRQIRHVPEERVSGLLLVPPALAGLGAGLERNTYNNVEAAKGALWENGLMGEQVLFASDLTMQYLTRFGVDIETNRLLYGYSDVRVLQPDMKALTEEWDIRVKGGWGEVAEAREATGMKVEDQHHVFLRGLGVREVPGDWVAPDPDEQPEPEPEPTPPELDAPDDGDGDGEEAPEEFARQFPVRKRMDMSLALRKASRAQRDWVRAQHVIWDQLTKTATGDVERAFDALADGVLTALELGDVAREGVDDWPAALARAVNAGPEAVAALLPPDLGATYLRAAYEALWLLAGETMFAAGSELLGVAVGWDLDDPIARSILEQGGQRVGLVDLERQTREAVFAALAEGQAAGDGVPELARRVRDLVRGEHMYPGIARQRGVDAARQYRAETIARSEAKSAQNRATIEVYRSSNVVEAVLVFDGVDCIMPETEFAPYGELVGLVRAPYSGPAITLTFRTPAGARRLTVGPNHPVLTRHGWVRAGLVDEGDELVYDLRFDDAALLAESNLEEIPAVQDIFRALGHAGAVARLAQAGDEFHGDQRFVNGEVEAVLTGRGLLREGDAALAEHLGEHYLMLPDSELPFKARLGGLLQFSHRLDTASHGLMGGGNVRAPLVSGAARGNHARGLRGGAQGDSHLAQNPVHRARGAAELRGDSRTADQVVEVEALDLIAVDGTACGAGASVGTETPGTVVDRSKCDAALLAGDGGAVPLIRLTHPFVSVRVEAIDVRQYEGWVYDASTEGGAFAANGIIARNCGWSRHDDPDLADGSTRSFDDAAQHLLAHPRCVRSFAPKLREGRG